MQAYLSHMIALPVKIFILKNVFSFNSFILHTQGTPAMYGSNHYQLDNALDKSQVLVVSFRAAFRPVVAYLHFSCSTVLTLCIFVLEMKKIVIFGSTGMTGVCALEAAVKKGAYFWYYDLFH